MSGWYDTKNNRLDFNSSKINSDGALASKAIGDAFMGVAQVMEDKKKQEVEDEKNRIALDKAHAEATQKAIDDTYLNYVDKNTGKFNQEQFDKDNVGLPMNQVSLDARLKQRQIEKTFNDELTATNTEAQKQINSAAAQEAFKFGSKDEFNKNINQDLLARVDAPTLNAIDKHYSDKDVQEAKLANAANKIEQAMVIANLKNENEKSKIQIEQEKLEAKKNKQPTLSAADSNAIFKSAASLYGGVIDPQTEQITGVDATQVKNILDVSARASEIKRNSTQDIPHAVAVKMAFEEKKAAENPPPPPPKPEDNTNGFQKMDDMFFTK